MAGYIYVINMTDTLGGTMPAHKKVGKAVNPVARKQQQNLGDGTIAPIELNQLALWRVPDSYACEAVEADLHTYLERDRRRCGEWFTDDSGTLLNDVQTFLAAYHGVVPFEQEPQHGNWDFDAAPEKDDEKQAFVDVARAWLEAEPGFEVRKRAGSRHGKYFLAYTGRHRFTVQIAHGVLDVNLHVPRENASARRQLDELRQYAFSGEAGLKEGRDVGQETWRFCVKRPSMRDVITVATFVRDELR